MSDPVVLPRHVRAAKLCMRGSRNWVEFHNLSWNDFVGGKIHASTFDAIGDPIVARVTAIAREESTNGIV